MVVQELGFEGTVEVGLVVERVEVEAEGAVAGRESIGARGVVHTGEKLAVAIVVRNIWVVVGVRNSSTAGGSESPGVGIAPVVVVVADLAVRTGGS